MHHAEDIKAYFMVTDFRFSMPDAESSERAGLLAEGEIKIIDMNNFTMKHMTRISIRVLRICVNYLQKAYPVRIKGIHIVNCPPYMNKIVAIIRPFISGQVFSMVSVFLDI